MWNIANAGFVMPKSLKSGISFAQFTHLWNAGASYSHLSAQTLMPTTVISNLVYGLRFFDELKITKRPVGRRHVCHVCPQVLEALSSGAKRLDVAKQYGISLSGLRKIMTIHSDYRRETPKE